MYDLQNILNSIPLDSMVTLGFYLATAIYIIFTTILYYHWNEYSVDPIVSRLTGIVYLGTTVPLIAIMGIVTLIL